jgi:hypothetical protein
VDGGLSNILIVNFLIFRMDGGASKDPDSSKFRETSVQQKCDQIGRIGSLITLGIFVKITELAQIIGLLFSNVYVMY